MKIWRLRRPLLKSEETIRSSVGFAFYYTLTLHNFNPFVYKYGLESTTFVVRRFTDGKYNTKEEYIDSMNVYNKFLFSQRFYLHTRKQRAVDGWQLDWPIRWVEEKGTQNKNGGQGKDSEETKDEEKETANVYVKNRNRNAKQSKS